MARPESSAQKITPLRREPRIIPREEHNVSRSNISEHALRVLYRLKNAGFRALLVGGGVRDLLLDGHPKDFDVATDALPEQVRELFRNCRLIGRRFRLAHVHFGREVVEVATFRTQAPDADDDADSEVKDGRIVRDNVYGSLDDDVWRRDFTVNALYYDIADFSIIDYVGGMADIKARNLRLIGDPEQRYREDPVRMLRAVRFAAKLDFAIDPGTGEPIRELAHLLAYIPGARLYDEFLKLMLGGHAVATFEKLVEYELLEHLFPQTWVELENEPEGTCRRMLDAVLANTDARVGQGKPVNPAFLIAALLWQPVREATEDNVAKGMEPVEAQHQAADAVISQAVGHMAIPRRITQVTREIWGMQPRLERRAPGRVKRLLEQPRFRAGYDFLLLRAESGEAVGELAEWWTGFQDADEAGQAKMLQVLGGGKAKGKRRRRRRRPKE